MKGKYSNLTLRIISAFIIGPVFICTILFLPKIFIFIMLLVWLGMLLEYKNICKNNALDLLFGILLVTFACYFLVKLEYINEKVVLLYFCMIWIVDSSAMTFGKWIGGIKLAPKISPNKTIAGLVGAMICNGGLVIVFNEFFDVSDQIFFDGYLNEFVFGMFFAILAQISDLFVSFFKRKYNLKDSGSLIPGHGGVLDRFDSILLTAPLLYTLVII